MKMLALVSALWLLPAWAGAQETADPRWSAWLGCWELVLESSTDTAPSPLQSGRGAATQPRSTPRPQICVQLAPGGAIFSTRVGAQTPVEQTVKADGTDQKIVDDECQGTQRTEWSRDGMSLFASANLTCAGDKGARRVSGLAILGPNETWTDIQTVDISGQQTIRVRRYRRADAPERTARGRGQALSLDDVKEASAKVSPRTLEAALVETRSTFELSGKRLIELQNAGVPASVTDLMVALSYPDRFVVERTARADRAPSSPMFDDPFFLGWAFGYPMWSDDFGFYSPLYGHYSPYFYSPFAYSYLRHYDPRYFGGGSFVVIGEGGGGAAAPARPSGTGRVVDGQGYTRVRPREAEVSTRGQTASTDGGSSSGGSSSSSSGGGGSVSTGGFSSGASGGDGGRTAQPR